MKTCSIKVPGATREQVLAALGITEDDDRFMTYRRHEQIRGELDRQLGVREICECGVVKCGVNAIRNRRNELARLQEMLGGGR